MILSDGEIEHAIAEGLITIDPVPTKEFYSASAVDLRLGSDLFILKTEAELRDEEPPGVERPIVLDLENLDIREWLRKYARPAITDSDGTYPFPPKLFLLGMTQEQVSLPKASKIAARVEGKSSFARTGLTIHMTAPTIHANPTGTIALEMYNFGNYPVRLRPGMRICQLIFEQTVGTPEKGYQGSFARQATKKKGGARKPSRSR